MRDSLVRAAAVALCVWRVSSDACEDDPGFVAGNGLPCSAWAGLDCFTTNAGLSSQGLLEVRLHCGQTCGTCIPAREYCDNGHGGERLEPDMSDISLFTFEEDDDVSGGPCEWSADADGLLQSSNAFGNPSANSLMGCLAILNGHEYTDFIASVDIKSFDNDGVGFLFGYKTKTDRFQVHAINDRWPDPAADGVPGPHLKVKRHNGKPALDEFNAGNVPFDLIAYTADDSLRRDDSFEYPNGNSLISMPWVPLPYSDRYHAYGGESTLTLIVKDRQMRAVFKAADGAIVGVWTNDELPASYVGGKIGFFTFADEGVVFSNLRVTDISDTATPLTSRCEDRDKTCDPHLGLCCDTEGCPIETPNPTTRPTVGYDDALPASVAAADVCPGPVGGETSTPEMTVDAFELVNHPSLQDGPCEWSNRNGGVQQTSNAWGNEEDNGLMGCLAILKSGAETEWDNFVLEVDVESYDNDGLGVVFGYHDIDDHYVAIAINDIWPGNPADSIHGPFLKLKKRNDKPCLDRMDATTTCWDTLAHIDAKGMDQTVMSNAPFEYERYYPYQNGEDFQALRLTVIVKDRQARVVFQSPQTETGFSSTVNSARLGNKFVGAWTRELPADYRAGRVGLMTYAHQATFTNLKITNLNRPVGGFCEGARDVRCDAGRSGLCVAAPLGDVCPDPVGARFVDTSSISSWDFVDDPYLNARCTWEITKDGRLSQTSNANREGIDYTLMGCNAVAVTEPVTDFIAQVEVENHDNDGVGFVFNWESVDRHCKVHACNDIWPSPAADNVGGPAFKVKCRNSRSCETQPMDATNDCYDTIAFVDRYGVYHDGMPAHAVAPSSYASKYVDYGTYTSTKMVLIKRENQLRALFTPKSGDAVVGAFSFNLPTTSGYTSGRVGLFTFADQAVFSDFSVTPLSGPGAVSEFCDGDFVCEADGLCGTSSVGGKKKGDASSGGGGSKKKGSGSGDDPDYVGVVLGLLALAFGLGAIGFFVGAKYGADVLGRRSKVEAILQNELELMDSNASGGRGTVRNPMMTSNRNKDYAPPGPADEAQSSSDYALLSNRNAA